MEPLPIIVGHRGGSMGTKGSDPAIFTDIGRFAEGLTSIGGTNHHLVAQILVGHKAIGNDQRFPAIQESDVGHAAGTDLHAGDRIVFTPGHSPILRGGHHELRVVVLIHFHGPGRPAQDGFREGEILHLDVLTSFRSRDRIRHTDKIPVASVNPGRIQFSVGTGVDHAKGVIDRHPIVIQGSSRLKGASCLCIDHLHVSSCALPSALTKGGPESRQTTIGSEGELGAVVASIRLDLSRLVVDPLGLT